MTKLKQLLCRHSYMVFQTADYRHKGKVLGTLSWVICCKCGKNKLRKESLDGVHVISNAAPTVQSTDSGE